MDVLANMDSNARNRVYCCCSTDAGMVSTSLNVDLDSHICSDDFWAHISSTRVFAESEFWLALVKVVTVIAFIVLGLLAIFGLIPFHGAQTAPLFSNLTAQGWFPHGFLPLLRPC